MKREFMALAGKADIMVRVRRSGRQPLASCWKPRRQSGSSTRLRWLLGRRPRSSSCKPGSSGLPKRSRCELACQGPLSAPV